MHTALGGSISISDKIRIWILNEDFLLVMGLTKSP
jgi:hypothetical protein